jgi:hypothetical protein
MEKNKKEDRRRNTFETGERKIYIYLLVIWPKFLFSDGVSRSSYRTPKGELIGT